MRGCPDGIEERKSRLGKVSHQATRQISENRAVMWIIQPTVYDSSHPRETRLVTSLVEHVA